MWVVGGGYTQVRQYYKNQAHIKYMNMKTTLKYILSLLIILFILTQYSCQKDKLEGQIITDPIYIENLYSNSKDTIIIDNQNLVLETEIYRNFFPGGPIDDKDRRLVAQLWIVNIDTILLTQNLSISKLYIINNDQVWTSEPETTPDNYTPENKLYLISKSGPEWETGLYVDVVISMTNLIDNKEKLLIARNQIIERIE